ncbi:MAG TPA: hypothetical protein VLB02_02920 [Candidatus Paceibacterota bacterium]|nr:hypothetical protein [Candidatus Paceibacterota bacterium]
MEYNRKKLFFIILILLLLVAGVWRYVTLRRSPGQTGEPVTYRQFFGLGGKTPAPAPGTGFQSDFTNEGEPDAEPSVQPVKNPAPQAPHSAFATPALTPTSTAQTAAALGNNYFGTSSGTPGRSTRGTGSSLNGNLDLEDDLLDPDTLLCDPRDITIEFTPAELDRLNQLEQQLAQLAPTLRSAENVEEEIANYENFKIYNNRIVEYKNFCFNKTAQFTTKPARRATPFWSDSTLNTNKFYPVNKAFSYAKGDNDIKSFYFIENYFNMNIW